MGSPVCVHLQQRPHALPDQFQLVAQFGRQRLRRAVERASRPLQAPQIVFVDLGGEGQQVIPGALPLRQAGGLVDQLGIGLFQQGRVIPRLVLGFGFFLFQFRDVFTLLL